jgi:putative PIN family toxin of toxin-antitoxin system
LARIGQIESVTRQEILNEYFDKLIIKFKFSQEKAQVAIDEVLSFSRLVEISTELRAVSADPDDDMVVECAVVGSATHIIIGDKHLLSLRKYQEILIVKATELVVLLS